MLHTKEWCLPGRRLFHVVFSPVIIFIFLFSCRPVRLVQVADDVTERRLIAMQEKFSRFFIRMERQVGRPEGNVAKYTDFYEDIRTDLDVLQMRNRAVSKSDVIRDQLDVLGKEIEELKTLHSSGFQDAREILVIREAMEETMVAMFKWQFTLKNRWK